jgi:1-phosphofructokinase
LAGSIPNSLPNDIYEEILAKLQNKGINFAVDATGDLLLNVLKYKPFLIKPNHHELGDIFGVEVKSEYEIAHYARKLQEMGARNVLVSRSKDGATLIDENGEVHSMGNVPGKVINPVGCGDSMVAGFVAGYSKTHDYKYALKLGSACGNATAFCSGLADKATIDLMLKSEYLK